MDALVTIFVWSFAFLRQVVCAEEAFPTTDRNGPAHTIADSHVLASCIDSGRIAAKRLDPANDFMSKDGRSRLDPSSRVSVQIAAAERAAADPDQDFPALRLRHGNRHQFQGTSAAMKEDGLDHQTLLSDCVTGSAAK
jgi:hypothetical protein